MNISLVRWVEAKAVEQTDLVLVEAFKLGVRQVLERGGLVQQLAIEQLPAESGGELLGDLGAAGAEIARDGDGIHGLVCLPRVKE